MLYNDSTYSYNLMILIFQIAKSWSFTFTGRFPVGVRGGQPGQHGASHLGRIGDTSCLVHVQPPWIQGRETGVRQTHLVRCRYRYVKTFNIQLVISTIALENTPKVHYHKFISEAVLARKPETQRRAINDRLLLALKHMPKRKGGPLYRVSYWFTYSLY